MRLDTGNKSKDKGRDPPDANDHRSEDHDENGQEYQERVPLPQVAGSEEDGDGDDHLDDHGDDADDAA